MDAHSASPVFVEDQKQGAYNLFDRKIIDGEAVLDAEQPQNIQVLKEKYRAMKKAQEAAAAQQQATQEQGLTGGKGGGNVIPMAK